MTNLLSALPDAVSSEINEVLAQAEHIRIERIVSQGQASREEFWYDQDENEFVLLVQGSARLQFEDETVEMKAGDWINIPAHRRHRVDWTTPDGKSVWLAVFYE
ncbi:MAG TPA: cupin domain-containing protein [Pirellulaceae bacterium]|jgi:cupin 2 domain-containing protein